MMIKVTKLILMSILLGLVIGLTVAANASEVDQLKIAVIDTGFSPVPFDTSAFKLCDKGHFDFDKKVAGVGKDELGHGSYVTGLINRYSGKKDFCFLQYKVFGPGANYTHVAQAIMKAYRNGAKAINMSISINMYDAYLHRVVKFVTSRGIKIFVSSGNENYNLNKYCRVYPSCFKRIGSNLVIVGALNAYNNKATYSNHGMKIDVWQFGDLGRARGTSFAAPRALGDYIRGLK